MHIIEDSVLCFVFEPIDLPYGKLKILKIGVEKEFKWRNNLPVDYIYYTSDIKDGDLILVCKSNKDALTNRFLSYKAIAVLSENYILIIDNIKNLQTRFPNSKIILFLGNDNQAIKTMNAVNKECPISFIHTPIIKAHPEINDSFEYVCNYGIEKYKRWLENKILKCT